MNNLSEQQFCLFPQAALLGVQEMAQVTALEYKRQEPEYTEKRTYRFYHR